MAHRVSGHSFEYPITIHYITLHYMLHSKEEWFAPCRLLELITTPALLCLSLAVAPDWGYYSWLCV
jgi:hypothetical protein